MGRKIKHGLWNHPLYNTWNHMMFRCYNPKSKFYKDYGARGIYVTERWHVVTNFIQDMGERPDGHSIDRIDNNGPYSPDNCKWANNFEQARNRRCVKKFTYKNETRSLKDWTIKLGLNHKTVWNRINKGWSFESAITIPISKSNGGYFMHGTVHNHY